MCGSSVDFPIFLSKPATCRAWVEANPLIVLSLASPSCPNRTSSTFQALNFGPIYNCTQGSCLLRTSASKAASFLSAFWPTICCTCTSGAMQRTEVRSTRIYFFPWSPHPTTSACWTGQFCSLTWPHPPAAGGCPAPCHTFNLRIRWLQGKLNYSGDLQENVWIFWGGKGLTTEMI